MSPELNFWLGSILLGFGVLLAAVAACRVFELRTRASVLVVVVVVAVFAWFDHRVLYRPHGEKEIKALLLDGYHLMSDCSARPYRDRVPSWMQGEQERWRGEVDSFIQSHLDVVFLQTWSHAAVPSDPREKDENGYRCTLLSVRVATLETVIAGAYNEKIQHQEYVGPAYVFTHED